MTRDIRRRLEKLESQVLPQPTEQEKKMRLWQVAPNVCRRLLFGRSGTRRDQKNRLRTPMRGHWDIRARMNFERPAEAK